MRSVSWIAIHQRVETQRKEENEAGSKAVLLVHPHPMKLMMVLKLQQQELVIFRWGINGNIHVRELGFFHERGG